MEIIIRNVKTEDLDGVAAVESLCFPAAEAASREALKRRIALFSNSFFVAERDGEIVGFVNGGATDLRVIDDRMYQDAAMHQKDGAYQAIFGLDVVPSCRHQGVAKDLVEHLTANAREEGKKGLILSCKRHMIPFYEQFGCRLLGQSESAHGGAVWFDMILEF